MMVIMMEKISPKRSSSEMNLNNSIPSKKGVLQNSALTNRKPITSIEKI
jgi:hypothetical protein